MSNPQKAAALHITQKDLIEQLKAEIDHLRREVNELREDKKSLRADKEHMKQTNTRLEIERAEMLKALLDSRRIQDAENVAPPGEEPQQQQQRMDAFVEWLQSYGSADRVGRLVPASYGHVNEVSDDLGDKDKDELESLAIPQANGEDPSPNTVSPPEKPFDTLPTHNDTHGYYQGRRSVPPDSCSRSSSHTAQRKKTPTQPRGLTLDNRYGQGYSQESSQKAAHTVSRSDQRDVTGQKRKFPDANEESHRKRKFKKRKRVEKPSHEGSNPTRAPISQLQHFNNPSTGSWSGNSSQSRTYSEARGRSFHRNFNNPNQLPVARASNQSNETRDNNIYVKGNQSQNFGGQSGGWYGSAPRVGGDGNWGPDRGFPSQHERFN